MAVYRQHFLSKLQGICQARFKHALLLQHHAEAPEQETQTMTIATTSCAFCLVPLTVAEPDRQNKGQPEAAKIAVTADVA